MQLNYKELGLRCGIEIHQQLDTRKLFCNCPSTLRDDAPDIILKRNLRAAAGETGEIDIAAAQEMKKERHFIYEAYKDTTCLVELDEEPPHEMNKDAIDIVLQVAKILNAKPIDLIQVMRKTVVDGSNTSGFQRTALVARNGLLETQHGKVNIPTICVEEEAAKIIEQTSEYAKYRLDRLGIPLVEIGTSPDINSPEQCKETAEKIGMILRSTGKVKRGLGTIRQDVNISIKNGERIEIKGAQDLKMIPKLVEYEVMRQKTLLEIKKELEKRYVGQNAKEKLLNEQKKDLTNTFAKAESKVIKSALDKKGIVLGIKLEEFLGLLGKEVQPGRRLGTELSDRVKIAAGVKGLFHSDELPSYGITQEETNAAAKALGCKQHDAFIIIADETGKADKAIDAAMQRAAECFNGVPQEVRKANDDGTTSYLRPIPGGARMYPETDVKPVKPDLKHITIPELIVEAAERYADMGLSKELAVQMSKSSKKEFFEKLSEKYVKVHPLFIADILMNRVKEMKTRLKLEPERITEAQIYEVFNQLNQGKISKQAVFEILVELAKGANLGVIKKYETMSDVELENEIKQIISQNKELTFNALVGKAMEKLRGKADGKKIVEMVKSRLNA